MDSWVREFEGHRRRVFDEGDIEEQEAEEESSKMVERGTCEVGQGESSKMVERATSEVGEGEISKMVEADTSNIAEERKSVDEGKMDENLSLILECALEEVGGGFNRSLEKCYADEGYCSQGKGGG